MSRISLCHRFAAWLTIGLITINPLMIHATSHANSHEQHQSLSAQNSFFSGKLENGFGYSIVSSSQLQERTLIVLKTKVYQEKEDIGASLLLQHAFFYGTKELSRSAIISQLNEFGLDINADSFISTSPLEHSIQFSLPNGDPATINRFLFLLQQFAFQANLKDENIEMARQHLVEVYSNEEMSVDSAKEEIKQQIQCTTADQVRKLYAKWYHPNLMYTFLISKDLNQEFVQTLNTYFNSATAISEAAELAPELQIAQYNNEVLSEDSFSYLLGTIQPTVDAKVFVIDGKIWMREPNWINKSFNGRLLGAFLTLCGIGGMIVAAPVVAPALLLAGGLSTVTGIYFLSSDYLKDPQYVEQKRKEDLVKGFEHAYKLGRAGITLTPFERRALFLQEMVDHPYTLKQLPILLVADVYKLTDSTFSTMFHTSELDVLHQIRRDFIQQRNQYKMLIENLDAELLALAAPYVLARDAALRLEQDRYNQNYYVVLKNQAQYERNQQIAAIEKLFSNRTITLEQKQADIDQVWVEYNNFINQPEMQLGLTAADNLLHQAQLEIEAAYVYQVELCKQAIQYVERMARYKDGKTSVTYFYNSELQRLLSQSVVFDPTIDDFLDLRAL